LSYQLVFGEDKVTKILASDGTKNNSVENVDFSQYTKDNPLEIVEIVPYLMFAQFGYQIKGGEILDYRNMEKIAEGNAPTFNGGDNPRNVIYGKLTSSVDFTVGNKKLTAFYSKEYFKRYSLGLDMTEQLLEKQAVKEKLEYEIEKAQESGENEEYIKQCINFKNNSNYTISNDEQKKLDTFNKVVVIYNAYLVSEVNANPEILKDSDLILITCSDVGSPYEKTRYYLNSKYKNKLVNAEDSSYNANMHSDPYYYDKDQRLSWNAAKYIFELSSEVGGVPVVMQSNVVRNELKESKRVTIKKTYLDSNNIRQLVKNSWTISQNGSNNNLLKLYLMLYQKDAYTFRSDYYRYVNKENGKYELQEGDAAIYWFETTFGDYDELGQDINWKADSMHAYNNILLNNGFIYNNDGPIVEESNYLGTEWNKMDISMSNLVSQTNGTYIKESFKYSKDVNEYFTNTNKISVAEALKYLLVKHSVNESQSTISKTSIRILDLEPSNEFRVTENEFAEMLQCESNIITIDRMTSQEFNATRTDLAGTYDLIYMGDNTEGLSTENNNSAYNGKIYMHTGDSLKQKDGTTEYYSGNDFITSKKEELAAYVAAGHPIIVADNIYDKNNIDTASNVYALMETVTANSKAIKKTTVQSSRNTLITAVNKQRPKVEIASTTYNKSELEVEVNITGLTELTTKKEVIELYADLDGDGVLEKSPVTTQNNITANGTYKLTYNRVTDTPNAMIFKVIARFDEENGGYTALSGAKTRSDGVKEKIRVLQIMPNNSTMDLSNERQNIGKKISAQQEYVMEVTTCKVDDFVALYDPANGGQAYKIDKNDKRSNLTDQLMNYDLVVLGFSNDYPEIDNQNGALDNLIAFIGQKKAVVFTNSVLQERSSYRNDKTKEAYATLRELSGMKRYKEGSDKAYVLNNNKDVVTTSGYTYAYLNKNIQDSKYSMFSYSDIKGEDWSKDSTFYTNSISQVNNGTVTIYPYNMDGKLTYQEIPSTTEKKSVSLLSIAEANAGTWQLDMTKVVGYYALTNNTKINDKTSARLLYSTSPNDIQNNYYLYHCDTVWYSGIGATALTNSHEAEAELFVNTLIGAYTLSLKAPTVEFVDVTTTSTGDSIAFVDADVFSNIIGTDKIVKFVPSDPNKNSSRLKASIYVKVDNELNPITNVYKGTANNKIDLGALTSGEEYSMVIDHSFLNSSSSVWIYVIVENDTGIGMAKCELRRRNDFNLD
ncbi:MAG: DUF5057 domain-containing protein, partial [bacterium]|nr:DUF5057 domain-containing protein [bacterium]